MPRLRTIRPHHWLCVGLFVVTLGTFWPATRNGFVNLDDLAYVVRNPQVSQGVTLSGLWWAATRSHSGNWHPVTWLSHMVDCELFGLDPFGHHLVSVLIHSLSAVLLFIVFHRMTAAMWRSLVTAALFAVHPLRVESVAWAAERKDVLSVFFFLATLWAYVGYVKRPSVRAYLPVVLLFVLGLMSKPMLVTVPAVLLLLDYWPLGRVAAWRQGAEGGEIGLSLDLRRLVIEKTPLFALSLGSCVVTVIAQSRGGAVGTLENYPVLVRLGNAVVSYAAYIRMTLWPEGLAVFYPHPGASPSLPSILAAMLLLACAGFWCWRWRFSQPFGLVGLLWFLGTLVPVIGIVHVGLQSRADRYTYIPQIGLLVMLVWGVSTLAARKERGRRVAGVLALATVLTLMALTRSQTRHWRNSLTLFGHTLSVTAENALAHNNLGAALMELRLYEEAAKQLEEALRIQPKYTDAHNNLGETYRRLGRLDEAIEHFMVSVADDPTDPRAHRCVGLAHAARGEPERAARHFREALRLGPDGPELRFQLARALEKLGRIEEARAEYEEALKMKPDHEPAQERLREL